MANRRNKKLEAIERSLAEDGALPTGADLNPFWAAPQSTSYKCLVCGWEEHFPLSTPFSAVQEQHTHQSHGCHGSLINEESEEAAEAAFEASLVSLVEYSCTDCDWTLTIDEATPRSEVANIHDQKKPKCPGLIVNEWDEPEVIDHLHPGHFSQSSEEDDEQDYYDNLLWNEAPDDTW